MASFNKITIVGNLGRDPELKQTPSGISVAKFSVATSQKKKSPDGSYEETTTWFRVTVWGRQAELASEYLTKGKQVYVDGRLSLEEYTDKDGNKRASLEVNASEIQFLGARGEGEGRAASASASTSGATKKASAIEEEDSIPF